MLKLKFFLAICLLGLLPGLAFSAEPDMRFEGIKLGDGRTEVANVAGEALQGDKVSFTVGEAELEVYFGKNKVTRIKLRYRKGVLPVRDFTERFGKPVRRSEGSSVLYVFTEAAGGVQVTLERVTGFPGYYVDVVAP